MARAHAGLARAYLSLGKIAEAFTAAEKAIEISPDLADAHVALGEIYFRQGKLTEAEHEFIDLIRAGKANARGYLGMARISAANSYYAQAKQMIDHAYALDPADPDVQGELIRILGSQARIQTRILNDAGTKGDDGKPGKVEVMTITAAENADPSTRPCRVISHTTSMQTAFTPMLLGPDQIHGYGLTVKLNGTSARLMLDTGASGIVVDRKIAEKANIKRLADQSIGGIGDKGDAAGYRGLVDSVKIGDLEFQGCHVDVIDKGSVVGDDGLIGADVFAQYLVELDFPNQKFKLSELPARPEPAASLTAAGSGSAGGQQFYNRYVAPEMKSYTPVAQFHHQLLVRTQVNSGSTRLFLLDTGSMMNTISPAAAKEVTKVSGDSTMHVKGLNGEVKNVFSGDDITLTFGSLRQRNLDIVAFDTSRISNSMGTEVSGILGFAMLRMLDLKIDYRDGLVEFNFDSKRWR